MLACILADIIPHRMLEQSLTRVGCERPKRTSPVLEIVSASDMQEPRLMPRRPTFSECFFCEKHSHDFSKLFTSTIENMYFIFSKALNPVSQARRKEERNPNPSLPFKLHLILKVCQHHHVCTNNTSVLAFSQTFSLKELSYLTRF